MSQTLEEVMTANPETLPTTATMQDAAELMAQLGIGDVVVVDAKNRLRGLVTDRDIVIRGVAKQRDPAATLLGDICSKDLISLSPTDSVDEAVTLMRTHAVRRIPVTDGGKAVGVVSLGDLARDRDPSSALADISRAPTNF